MDAALDIGSPRARGEALLLHHCLAVGGSPEVRPPARTRLERAVGGDLARLLVLALVPQGRRGSSSP